MAWPLISRGPARANERRGTERERSMSRVERVHPTVTEWRARSHYAGTGPAHRRVPAKRTQTVMRRPEGCDALPLTAVSGACGDVPGEQPTLSQRPHDARMTARQSSTCCLHEPESA